jgi:plastocyanin
MSMRIVGIVPRLRSILALVALVTACGGGASPTATTPSPSPAPAPSPAGATITIANNAVSPASVTVSRGSRVTFVNNDTRVHDMESNPHPVHTDCPEINQVGLISPGQSRQTGALNTVRTCGYHDHDQDTVTSLQGTITIQ